MKYAKIDSLGICILIIEGTLSIPGEDLIEICEGEDVKLGQKYDLENNI